MNVESAMMICFREKDSRSQMMHDPSSDDDTASSSFLLSVIDVIYREVGGTSPS
jgi:hypothetical protein